MEKADFFSEQEMAEILRIKKSTLCKNRCLGVNHPPYKKYGKVVLYPKKEFERWMDALPLNQEIK